MLEALSFAFFAWGLTMLLAFPQLKADPSFLVIGAIFMVIGAIGFTIDVINRARKS